MEYISDVIYPVRNVIGHRGIVLGDFSNLDLVHLATVKSMGFIEGAKG